MRWIWYASTPCHRIINYRCDEGPCFSDVLIERVSRKFAQLLLSIYYCQVITHWRGRECISYGRFVCVEMSSAIELRVILITRSTVYSTRTPIISSDIINIIFCRIRLRIINSDIVLWSVNDAWQSERLMKIWNFYN